MSQVPDGRAVELLIILIVVVLVAVVVFAMVRMYNRLVRARLRVAEAWAQVDSQLQRRHDLVANLADTVKAYAAHERQTFEAVTAARARASRAAESGHVSAAENEVSQALGRLLAISENYPQLKADANFRQLQGELANTEDLVASARGDYNASVRTYDEAREMFPASIMAGMFGFGDRGYIEVETVDVRGLPGVAFE
jgi:LemA protein